MIFLSGNQTWSEIRPQSRFQSVPGHQGLGPLRTESHMGKHFLLGSYDEIFNPPFQLPLCFRAA